MNEERGYVFPAELKTRMARLEAYLKEKRLMTLSPLQHAPNPAIIAGKMIPGKPQMSAFFWFVGRDVLELRVSMDEVVLVVNGLVPMPVDVKNLDQDLGGFLSRYKEVEFAPVRK